MMTLGQAAGTAAALFGPEVAQADPDVLRRALRRDGVALTLEDGYLEAIKSGRPSPPNPLSGEGVGG